jgi:dihydroorotate dehydrogenase electron transfer subunit
MPFDIPARVLRHEPLNPDHFLLTLHAPPIARAARPGQFVMLKTRAGNEPLLRRPMSVHRVLSGRGALQILYKVVGCGTRYLSLQPEGTAIDTLGPLGRGFRPPAPGETPVLVAGGIGIAIFPFLVEDLLRRRRRPILLFGARGRRDLVGLSWYRGRRVPVRVATEDGGMGHRGYVTALLEPFLKNRSGGKGEGGRPHLYVCGPTPMLRAVRALAVEAGVPCQLALESQMPCGIGVCLGCVVRRPGNAGPVPYPRVCTEGPVFAAETVEP